MVPWEQEDQEQHTASEPRTGIKGQLGLFAKNTVTGRVGRGKRLEDSQSLQSVQVV